MSVTIPSLLVRPAVLPLSTGAVSIGGVNRRGVTCVAAVLIVVTTLLVNLTLPAGAGAATRVRVLCATVRPGQAHCDADLLVNRRGRLVRPVPSRLHRATPSKLPASVNSDLRSADLRSSDLRSAGMAMASVSQPAAGTPQWLQQAYDLTWLSANRGSGDTVAVVDAYADPDVASDLATFRAAYGLSPCTQASGCLSVVNEQGQAAPLPAQDAGWGTEETLDLEAVSSVCPNCRLLLVEASSPESNDLQAAMQAAVDLGADQIADSWSITDSQSPFTEPLLTAAAGQRVPAVFAASGDVGPDAAGSAEYPAALSSVTAVGGTTLRETDSATAPRGYAESGWSDSGSGCATAEPALPYQPATGCAGRAYADVSADANPGTGLGMYDAAEGGWEMAGGTSLSTPLVAAFDALTGVDGGSPAWAYADSALLNDAVGVTSDDYDGPTGVGSISGDVVSGAPGIAGPAFETADGQSDAVRVTATTASLTQGLYANDNATTYLWQYGTSTAYGHVSAPAVLRAGARAQPVTALLTGLRSGMIYHYRLVARNAEGISVGPDLTLATARSTARSDDAQHRHAVKRRRRPQRSRGTHRSRGVSDRRG